MAENPSSDDVVPKQLSHSIIAYAVGFENLDLVTAPRERDWMDTTADRFAYRCLPLLIANQSGWFLVNQRDIEVVWNGGRNKDALTVKDGVGGVGPCPAVSLFGHGIVTWHMPYLFRTPPGFNLLVRGPSNLPKDNAYPLEGIVETDWAVATFTMNWQILRPNVAVRFLVGEPVCMIVPQRRGELESFQPCILSIESAPEERDSYRSWVASRGNFLRSISGPSDPQSRSERWQKHYFRGSSPDGTAGADHTVKRHLLAFASPQSPEARADVRVDTSGQGEDRKSFSIANPSGRLAMSCFICSSPRSGSSLLAEALESTGIAGRPAEYFDPNPVLELAARKRLNADTESFPSFVQKVLSRGTTDNGVFACKTHWHQFEHLAKQLVPTGARGKPEMVAFLSLIFPNMQFVWIRRRDRVRQAVSYARAVQSEIWWSIEGQTPSPKTEPRFDSDIIDARMKNIESSEMGWQRLFVECDICPHIVWYEELSNNFEETVFGVLRHLNLPTAECVLPRPRLQKQADLESDEWVRRYTMLLQERGLP